MRGTFKVKRNPLAQQVVDRIRALIAGGTYAIGDRLPSEGVLCAEFGVGRSTLREAMRVLSSRGIVNVRHGEGTFVAEHALRETFEERLGRAALRDVYEVRLLLELPMAELAARRRNARDVAAMRKALKQRALAAENGNVAAYTEADFGFHLAVARASKNAALFDVYASLVEVVKPIFESAIDASYLKKEDDSLHASLCEAIASADVARVRQLVRAHLHGSHTGVARHLRVKS